MRATPSLNGFNNSDIKWTRCPCIVTYCLEKIMDIPTVFPSLSVWGTSQIENKIADRKFYWSSDQEFSARLGVWNYKSAWSVDKFVRKFMIFSKNSSSVRFRVLFFQASRNSVGKRKVLQDEGSDTKFSNQRLPWVSLQAIWGFRNPIIVSSYFFTNESSLTVPLHKIKGTLPGRKKVHEWKELFC